eukprot:579665-Rhodomonas_salina.1
MSCKLDPASPDPTSPRHVSSAPLSSTSAGSAQPSFLKARERSERSVPGIALRMMEGCYPA